MVPHELNIISIGWILVHTSPSCIFQSERGKRYEWEHTSGSLQMRDRTLPELEEETLPRYVASYITANYCGYC